MTNQLRIRVAEAMGWKRIGPENPCSIWPMPSYVTGEHGSVMMMPDNRKVGTAPPRYDTDANQALLLVARLKEQGWIFILSQQPDGKWFATFVHAATDRYAKATEETMPMAVATAFLATQGETKL